jgi:tRNA (guanine9-N1)-methyltransferase
MAGVEESPSKKRKLDYVEDPKHSTQRPSNLKLDNKSGANHSEEQQPPETEGNDLSNPTAEGQVQGELQLSKSQLKKRRKQAEWEAGKEFRKLKRRDQRKEKQARKAGERAELEQKIAKGEIDAPVASSNELKKRHTRPVQVPVTLILDCDFDELMTEKELISLGAQLTRCYSENRHSKHRAHMVISSWNGALRTRFETVLTNHHKSWKGVRFLEKDFVDAAREMDAVMRSPNGGKLVGAFAPLEQPKTSLETDGDGSPKENGSASISLEEGSLAASVGPALEEPKEVALVEESVQTEEPIAEDPKEDHPSEEPSNSLKATTESSTSSVVPNPSSQPESFSKDEGPGAAATDQPPENTSAKERQPTAEPSIVYLTSDSPHTLSSLSPNTSYIIGGIVDKNRHKGLCYRRACERGIPTAKLPIGEYMTMQSRSVLAVNHVVEIMLKWLETGDWGEAFLDVIPKRKEAKLRVKGGGVEDGRDGDRESEDEGDEGGTIEVDEIAREEEEDDGIE